MEIEMTAKQAKLLAFAAQILIDDETTSKADRKALEAVQGVLNESAEYHKGCKGRICE